MNRLSAWAKAITFLHWTITIVGAGMVAVIAFNPSVSVWSSVCSLVIVGSLLTFNDQDSRRYGDELQKDIAHTIINVVVMDLVFIGFAVYFQLQKSLTVGDMLTWTGGVILAGAFAYAVVFLLRAALGRGRSVTKP